jgi:hypothetical protein
MDEGGWEYYDWDVDIIRPPDVRVRFAKAAVSPPSRAADVANHGHRVAEVS